MTKAFRFFLAILELGGFAEIIDLVKHCPANGDETFRPDLECLYDSEMGGEDYVLQCMKDCWAENPDSRPDFVSIRGRLKRMKEGK